MFWCGLLFLTGCTAAGSEEGDQPDEMDNDHWQLPTGQMDEDELAARLLGVDDVSLDGHRELEGDLFPRSEYEHEYLLSPWSDLVRYPFYAALPPLEAEMRNESCVEFWDLDNESGDGADHAMSQLLGEDPEVAAEAFSGIGDAASEEARGAFVAVLLRSYDHSVEAQANSQIWEEFYEACTGPEAEIDDVMYSRSVEPYNPGGVDGFEVHSESPEETLSLQFVHLDLGHNSLRILGVNVDGEEMADVVHSQLEKLEESH